MFDQYFLAVLPFNTIEIETGVYIINKNISLIKLAKLFASGLQRTTRELRRINLLFQSSSDCYKLLNFVLYFVVLFCVYPVIAYC